MIFIFYFFEESRSHVENFFRTGSVFFRTGSGGAEPEVIFDRKLVSIGSWWCIGSDDVDPEVAKKLVKDSRELLRLIYDCYEGSFGGG